MAGLKMDYTHWLMMFLPMKTPIIKKLINMELGGQKRKDHPFLDHIKQISEKH